jgi:hypothetical protein
VQDEEIPAFLLRLTGLVTATDKHNGIQYFWVPVAAVVCSLYRYRVVRMGASPRRAAGAGAASPHTTGPASGQPCP